MWMVWALHLRLTLEMDGEHGLDASKIKDMMAMPLMMGRRIPAHAATAAK